MAGKARLKKELAALLAGPDWRRAPDQLQSEPIHRRVSILLGLLSAPREITAWRAAALLGETVAERARQDPEKGREVLRRLAWSLNEESGSIIRAAPLAMAEVMVRHHGLAREFASLLLSYLTPGGCYLEYPPLQQNVIWGLGRLARDLPQVLDADDMTEALLPFLHSPEAALRGAAAWALGGCAAGWGPAREELEGLLNDNADVRLMEEGEPVDTTVAELAGGAMQGGT